ncbi:AAA family ATPase, partial [Acinetobacter baumannii]
NTIIIMTSNLGSHLIQDAYEQEKSDTEKAAEKAKLDVLALLKQKVRPEFLNRVDEIIMFAPLTRNDIKGIVSIQLQQLKKHV